MTFTLRCLMAVLATALAIVFLSGALIAGSAASASTDGGKPDSGGGTKNGPNEHSQSNPNQHAYGDATQGQASTGSSSAVKPTPLLPQSTTDTTARFAPLFAARTVPASATTPTPAEPDRTLPGTPSILSHQYLSPSDLAARPEVPVAASFFTIALVMLVLIATEFVGEAVAHQYSRLAAIVRRRRLAPVVDRVSAWIVLHPVVSSLVLVTATSAVFTLVDPGVGFDVVTLRMWLSCVAAILVVNYLTIVLTGVIGARAWAVRTAVRIMPWGLVIAGIGVGLSRVLNVSPGFLVGAILGISTLAEPGARLVARVVELRAGLLLTFSVTSWLVLPAIPQFGVDDPRAFWSLLASESLVAISAAGLTALLVGLLPLALLEGGELWRYSRREWAITFAAAALAFGLIQIPAAANWLEVDNSIGTWIVVTICIIVIAAVVYFVSLRSLREGHEEPSATRNEPEMLHS